MNKRELRHWGRHASVVVPAIVVGVSLAPSGVSAQTALPDINVIAPTPLSSTPRSTKPSNTPAAPGSQSGTQQGGTPAAGAVGPADLTAISRDKVPTNTEVLTTADFNHEYSQTFLDALNRGLPGVSLSDQNGNTYQKDLNYRGFTASPVQGTPQGIAIYQNGVRINESWGDVVNWDFIPEKAISKMELQPSNPVFGLNAIGGAMSIQMKNGFTWQGLELEAQGGSYGHAQGSIEYGKQEGNFAFYGLFESAADNGWRDFAGQSHVNRTYIDLGARNENTEFHLSFTGADDTFGNVAGTPLDFLSRSYTSVYTWPQSTKLQMAMLQANLTHNFSDTLSFQGNVYWRGFWQSHVDGNGTDAFPCSPSGNPNGSKDLCLASVSGNGIFGNGSDPLFGTNPTLNFANKNGLFLGEDDDNQVASNTIGGTAQFTNTSTVFGHENHFVFGASVDHGYTQFSAQSELGTIDPNTLYVQGMGVFLNQPDADFSLTSLHATNTYTGVFMTDTFDVTNRLSITAGGRFNLAQIKLQDETGQNPDLDSTSTYQRFNPMIGATYKITPNITAYADYAESNRAPTPLELGCSSPTRPCMIDTFLVADPPLQQVVSHTIEAGFRGKWGDNPRTGLVTWGLGVYHTELDNDIVEVASDLSQGSALSNFGFFQNIPKDLRQGVEAKIDYTSERWKLYANYTYVDATYQSNATLSSPNNPNASCVGAAGTLASVGGDSCTNPFVTVHPGDHIGGIPAQRFKVGAEYLVTDRWKVGADLNVVGSSYLVHDDTNQFDKVPAYAVLNLHTSYQLTKNVELFGVVNNALNQQYYLYGTFADNGGFTAGKANGASAAAFNNPQSFIPGAPFEAYAGIKMRFDPDSGGDLGLMAALDDKAPEEVYHKAPEKPFSWSGFYVGGNVGNAMARSWTGNGNPVPSGNPALDPGPEAFASNDLSALTGGAQIGYNWQVSPTWLIGFETDFQGSNLASHTSDAENSAAQMNRELDWFGTVRARAGVTRDRLLVYGTAGLAYGGVKDSAQVNGDVASGDPSDFIASVSSTKTGWTVGGGLEYALPGLWGGNWTLRGEYLFVSLSGGDSATAAGAAGGQVQWAWGDKTDFQVGRIGLNYKF